MKIDEIITELKKLIAKNDINERSINNLIEIIELKKKKYHAATKKSDEIIREVLKNGWESPKTCFTYKATNFYKHYKKGTVFIWECTNCKKKAGFESTISDLRRAEKVRLCGSCADKKRVEEKQKKKEEKQKKLKKTRKGSNRFWEVSSPKDYEERKAIGVKTYSKDEEQKILEEIQKRYN